MNIKKIISAILLYGILLNGSQISCSGDRGTDHGESGLQFTFGVIADCQYSDKETHGKRIYSLSKQKLINAVKHFNEMDLEFVLQLGDLIDEKYVSYHTVLPILKHLNMPTYHVLGNHDFSISDTIKNKLNETLNLRSRYYDFTLQNYRFIVLDGNDISFHAYPEETQDYKDAVSFYQRNVINSPEWNGAIGKKQRIWLISLLDKANTSKEKVIILCHFPIYPKDEHNLWNATEVLKLIESYSCVKAYLSGHNHQGNYGVKAGIHHLTFKGMVDTKHTSYSIAQVYPDSIKVIGYGREKSRTLSFKTH